MVDYSKWNNLDVSDDEEPQRKLNLHKFDKPSSVTLGDSKSEAPELTVAAEDEQGSDDAMGDHPIEPEDEATVPGQDRREDVLQCRALGERALRSGNIAEGVRLLEKAMRLGGQCCPGLEDLLEQARAKLELVLPKGNTQPESFAQATAEKFDHQVNGGVVADRYCWSQTRETIELHVFVPEASKANQVKVSVSEINVKISVGNEPVLSGDWEFKVTPEEDPDWELTDSDGRRAVRLTVRKAPMPGGFSVAVWWSRALKGDPSIDVRNIQGRKSNSEKSEQFAKAWGEAHAMFREKVKNRTPIPVDLSGCVEPEQPDTSMHP